VKVCNVDLRLDSLGAFRAGCGSGEIVRLKPNLLRAFASARERELVGNVTNEPRSAQVPGNV
jgi:hypothetical protein